jgi:uncharacterized small protein (DUF1192 family)
MEHNVQNNLILNDEIEKKIGLLKNEIKKKTQNNILVKSILWVWLQ